MAPAASPPPHHLLKAGGSSPLQPRRPQNDGDELSSPPSSPQNEDSHRPLLQEPGVKPNLAATAFGARKLLDQHGVLPFHGAVHGPFRPVDATLREQADSRLVEMSLVLNTWMPQAAAPEEHEDIYATHQDRPRSFIVCWRKDVMEVRARNTLRPSAHGQQERQHGAGGASAGGVGIVRRAKCEGLGGLDTQEHRAVRSEAAEAERLAAAADAATFFQQQEDKRTKEFTIGGLAQNEIVRQARCRPWDQWAREDLKYAGIDPEAAERAVRTWEPQLFDDPIITRHVAACWDAEIDYRNRGLQTLVKEGYLSIPGIGRKWVMLRKNKGLLWSQVPNGSIVGMILFTFLIGLSKAPDDECSIEFTRSTNDVQGTDKVIPGGKVRLCAQTAEEAHEWLQPIAAQFELFKVNNGIGHLEAIRKLRYAEDVVIKLPPIDLFDDVKQRTVIFHVKEGQEFQEGDVLCTVERAKDLKPDVQVFANFAGCVTGVEKSRIDNRSNPKFSYFAIGDPILRLLRDADWTNSERFLPRPEPTDAEKKALANRLAVPPGPAQEGLLEAVDDAEQDDVDSNVSMSCSRASSRMPTTIAGRRRTSRSRIPRTGSDWHGRRGVEVTECMPMLVTAARNNAISSGANDDFWTRNATILDSIDTLQPPHAPPSDTRPRSRAAATATSGWRVGETAYRKGPALGGGEGAEGGSAGGRDAGWLRQTANSYTSNSLATSMRCTSFAGGVGPAAGELLAQSQHEDRYGLNTLEARYSSRALAAASKILLNYAQHTN